MARYVIVGRESDARVVALDPEGQLAGTQTPVVYVDCDETIEEIRAGDGTLQVLRVDGGAAVLTIGSGRFEIRALGGSLRVEPAPVLGPAAAQDPR